jgi:hypothetical protein
VHLNEAKEAGMESALDQLLEERRQWREIRRRRLTKVNERCALGWKNFCIALHHEVVRHNTLGRRPMLGLRRNANVLEIHRAGNLAPLLTFSLNEDHVQIVYSSPLHQDSVLVDRDGSIIAAFLGSLLLMAPDGRMMRFGYSEAAQYLLAPVLPS